MRGVPQFQTISLKLLAEKVILGAMTTTDAVRNSTRSSARSSVGLYIPGEITGRKLTLLKPVVMYTSPNNPGAEAAATKVQDGLPQQQFGGLPLLQFDLHLCSPRGQPRGLSAGSHAPR